MDERSEIREFLVSRRARVTPDQVGLRSHGARRVPGLRREEVALLAGLSVDYYARLERGRISGASEQVLDAIARALLLDEAERAHLFDLANAAARSTRARTTHRPNGTTGPRPEVLAIIDALTVPAYVRTARMDILAANSLCRALYGSALNALPLNLARFVFLDPRSEDLFADWPQVADDTVAALRVQAGRDPRDTALSNLIGELSTRSDAFVHRWAQRNVASHLRSRKVLRTRVVGEIELTGNALELPGDDLTLIVYTADVGSAADEQLRLLAAWAATPDDKPAPSTTPFPPNRK